MNSNIIEKAPRLSLHNRNKIKEYTNCGCYFCLRIFKGRDITEWVDVVRSKWFFIFWKIHSPTAVCPNCGLDTVLADVDNELLIKIHERWFCGSGKKITGRGIL